MSIKVRIDSLYKFANPYFDEVQEEYVWGIADPPDPIKRDDDQFYSVREGDRADRIAYNLLGDPKYFWIVLHYNGLSSALDLDSFIDRQIRLPSRETVERVYTNAT